MRQEWFFWVSVAFFGFVHGRGGGSSGRKIEEERQKLERVERWERIGMVLGYIILLCRYIILICYMIK